MRRRVWREGRTWAASYTRPTSRAEVHGASLAYALWWLSPLHQLEARRRARRWVRRSPVSGSN